MRAPGNRSEPTAWDILTTLGLGRLVTVAYLGRALQHYTMRVPVPRGREDEARAPVKRFMGRRWSSPPRRVESVR